MIKVKLSEICDLQNGYAFKSSDYVENSNTLSCRMSNIRLGGIFDIEYNPRFLPDSFADQYKGFLLKDGDLVIAMTDLANDPKLLGVPTLVQTDGRNILLNQRVGKLIIKDSSKVDNKYLQHVLNDPKTREYYRKFASGGLQINLGKSDLLNVEIPLPPLAEQRRIASILDQADELRQKRQQAIEKLDQLLQATFIDMFGDPVSNPKGWEKKLLSDLVTIDAPLVEPMEKKFENLLHYGPDRISKDSGKLLPALTAKEDMLISKKFLCDDRHILYSKIRPYLNKVAMVQEKCLCSADVYPVEPKSQLTKHFLWHILRSKSFLDHAETFSNRANIPKINRNQFLQYECIVPTMEAQQKFENISKDIQRQIDFQNLSLESIEKLFNSLQHQAFNGTL